ncbi:GSM1 Glucose starvation modulator protein 1 [Candida maltosa Xu316]
MSSTSSSPPLSDQPPALKTEVPQPTIPLVEALPLGLNLGNGTTTMSNSSTTNQQIKDILEVPPHINESSSIINPNLANPNANTAFTPETLMMPDPLQFHTTTMLNTTTDVLNKLLTDHYETESLLSANNSTSGTNNNNNSIHNDNLLSSVTPRANGHHFNSNYLNEEYLKLGDILLNSKPVSPSPSNTSASEYNSNTLSPTTFGYISGINFEDINQSKKKVVQKLKDSRPFISLGYTEDSTLRLNEGNINSTQTEDFLDHNTGDKLRNHGDGNPIINFTTKFTTDYVSPLVTNNLYQSVGDIYSYQIMNYEYPDSYHALTKFLKERFAGNDLSVEDRKEKRAKLLVILKLIASYRPTFIAAHKSLLKPQDLLFLEMSLQRSLLDYKKLVELSSSPSIMWRRTGEIIYISEEMGLLIGYSPLEILEKRFFIFSLMPDEEIITYFKFFKNIAVNDLQSSIAIKIKLINKTGNLIEFCTVLTIKRDIFDIPMLIVGQFLPVL